MGKVRICILLLLSTFAFGCAAKMHLDRAAEARAANRHREAVTHMEHALSVQPSLANNSDFMKKLNTQRSEAAYEAGIDQVERHEYDQATESFEKALKLQPGFAAAQTQLEKLGPKAANYLLGQSTPLIREGQLDKAIQMLQRANGFDPSNSAVALRLQSTIDQRRVRQEKVDALMAEADAFAKQRDWEKATNTGTQASNLIPHDEVLSKRVQQIYFDATTDWLNQGQSLTKAGQLTEADTALERALTYGPQDDRVHRALAQVDIERGLLAEKKNLYGAAMGYYQAAEAHKKGSADRRLTAARGEVLKRHAIDIHVQSEDATLSSMLRDYISRRAQTLFSYSGTGRPVNVSLDSFTTETKLVDSRKASHSYTIYTDVPNPEIPKLQSLLRSAQSNLNELRRQYAYSCTHCHGHGYYHHRDTRRRHRCDPCHGTGRRYYRIDQFDISRAERDVRDLERKLRSEPATIQQAETAYWDYTVHTWQKKAQMGATMTIAKQAAVKIDKSMTEEDRTIDGDNSEIGLRPDPLSLMSDKDFKVRLIRQVAEQGSRHVTQSLIPAKLKELEAELKNATGDEATELRVAIGLIRERM